MVGSLTIVGAWDELNKVNNKIELLETLIATNSGISASKLKEILTQCSFVNNDRFINNIIRNDKNAKELRSLYIQKNAYESYIYKEIDRMSLTEPILCVAFLKEYLKYTWEEISKRLHFSNAQCRRYYDEYKGRTPKNNSFLKNEQK